VSIGPIHWMRGALTPLTPPPPPGPPPPAQHVAETRPSFPVSIRYTRDGVAILVNCQLINENVFTFSKRFFKYCSLSGYMSLYNAFARAFFRALCYENLELDLN
jgi:hypothetical protein